MENHQADQSDDGTAPEHLNDPRTIRQSTRIEGRPISPSAVSVSGRAREDEGKDEGTERDSISRRRESAHSMHPIRIPFSDAASHSVRTPYRRGTDDFLIACVDYPVITSDRNSP